MKQRWVCREGQKHPCKQDNLLGFARQHFVTQYWPEPLGVHHAAAPHLGGRRVLCGDGVVPLAIGQVLLPGLPRLLRA